MSTFEGMERSAAASPRTRARVAGVFYLLNIITGSLALVLSGPGRAAYGDAANLAATACYAVVTLLFYGLFKPVNRTLSLIAAALSLAGCATGALRVLHLADGFVSPLAFFGGYCLLIGYLILRSNFLPRFLGLLMAFGGLGWLTFLSAPLARQLSPYNLAPGILGEGVLAVWLVAVGLDAQRWRELAGRPGA